MRHVLFVDDDPAVLSGLRRALLPMRSQWQATFAADGAMALRVLSEEPADVVVSDMRMPGLDGAELLAEVRRQWPETVRIILSGFADQGAALRSVPVAHQFLSKPCDAKTLAATLQDACHLQDRLLTPGLRQLVGGLGALPAAPRSFAAITEALGQPETSATTVASIIEQDPACSAKLLQVVNSAFFGLARRICDVQQAVAYLGVLVVRNIVLAAEAESLFGCGSPELAAVAEEINDHSLLVAAAACEAIPPKQAPDAYVAGVLHDVGRLALAATTPESFFAVQEEQSRRRVSITVVEQEQFGATHAEVGAYLLRLWGLPFPLVNAIAAHHDPESTNAADPVVAALAAAEATVADASSVDTGLIARCWEGPSSSSRASTSCRDNGGAPREASDRAFRSLERSGPKGWAGSAEDPT